MGNLDQITNISILGLLYKGALDSSKGVLYKDNCFIITNSEPQAVDNAGTMFRYPSRLDSFVVALCHKGSATLDCNMQEITFKQGDVLLIRPDSIIKMTTSKDCGISTMLCSKAFLERLNISSQKFFPHANELAQCYTIRPSKDTFAFLTQLLESAARCITQSQKMSYYHETVRSAVRTFGYYLMSLILQKIKASENSDALIPSRKEETFRKFIRLVGTHYKKERKITYYAGLMNLSPKYLSLLIREISGHGPAEWINNYVLQESKNLLKYSSLSIQQIAYEMSFPNQSFFGRWFKTHTGTSPKRFRDSK